MNGQAIKPFVSQGSREAGMMTAVGEQGVGKTYENMATIVAYTQDNILTKVRGRKALALDTNGEYTAEQFARNGHPNFPVKKLALKDVYDWCRSPLVEFRRIDMSTASIAEKKSALEYTLRHSLNCLLGMEDINTIVLNMTHMEEIVGRLVNLRHRAVDVLISYQSLRAVEPRIIANSRWFRMHHQADNVDDIKDKIGNPALFKISQIIVDNRYSSGDERFFTTIHNLKRKIEGPFSIDEFKTACKEYLNLHRSILKNYALQKDLNESVAREALIEQYVKQFYGN